MIEAWGKTSGGRDVQRVSLFNGDLTARIITFGASIQDLRIEGHSPPLILGFDAVSAYEAHGLYFGAIVGRFANRIVGGSFDLGGQTHQLTVADGDLHHLHGGPAGFFSKLWDIEAASERSVTLKLVSPDGDMGYPGNLTARCTYTLSEDNSLEIELCAQCDADTVCNLVNHAYFNLDDGGATNVNLHRLRIDADHYLVADETNAPTGEADAVSGSALDFRVLRPIGDHRAYDHNFCLTDQARKLTEVARLVGAHSAIEMDVLTTEPGLQLYGGSYINSMVGLDSIRYGAGSGLCLEAQIWPDAPNHDNFPNATLKAGEKRSQKTVYRFNRTG